MKRTLIILSYLFSSGMLFAQDIKLDELLDTYFKVTGQDKIENIQTYRIAGRMSQEGAEFQIVLYSKRPDAERMEIYFSGTKMTAVVTGQTGWIIMPLSGSSDPQDMSDDMIINTRKAYGSQKSPYGRYNNPLINWKVEGSSVELHGIEESEGRKVYDLKLTFKDGDIVDYYMDKENYRILKLKEKSLVQGQLVDVEEIFSDFMDEGGFMFPHKSEIYYNGSLAISLTIDKIEFNLAINDTIFIKPAVTKQ